MSDPVVKVLIPKGSKRCPKCAEIVKGPRTKMCPHCKADISKPGKPKAKKTGGKRGRPRKTAIAVEVKSVDPYTFNEVAGIGNLVGIKGSTIIRRAGALFGNNQQSYRETLAYLDEVPAPEHATFENIVVTA